MKTILFFYSLFFITMSSFGQWYKPYPNNLELWTAKSNIVYAGSDNMNYYLYSTDNIHTWDTVYPGVTIKCLEVDDNNQVVIGYNGGILLANNPAGPFINILQGVAIFYVYIKNNYIAASAGDHVYLSSDTGNTWVISYNPPEPACYNIRIYNDTTILASWYNYGMDACYIWKTNNWGNSWVLKGAGGASAGGIVPVHSDIYQKDPYVFIATQTGVLRSQDNGNTFSSFNYGLPPSFLYRVMINFTFKNNVLLTGTLSRGVFITYDNGDHWNTFNAGLDSPYVAAKVAATDSFLYTTDNGIWMRSIADMLTINETVIGTGFYISPNPAKEQATLYFSENGITNITIYNIFGREVYYHNIQNSKVANSETINVWGWAKGMYIVKANTNEGIKTSKLMVE